MHGITRILIISALLASHAAPAYSQHGGYLPGPVEGILLEDGFLHDDSNYHAIAHASDGYVYWAACTHHPDTHVHLFRYDPETGGVHTLADMGEVFGEDGTKNIPQGKIHCDLFEHRGKLWSGTHVGLYERGGRKDHGPYPGGHFFSYDLRTGEFDDLGIGAAEEGLVSMAMDKKRGRLYALTYPSGLFLVCDIGTRTIRNYGIGVSGYDRNDEDVHGSIDRSPGVDPRTGNVYWWNVKGTVDCYNHAEDRIVELEHCTLERPALKVTEPSTGRNTVFWRSMRWSERLNRFLCTTFFGEHLFTWDPVNGDIQVIDRIATGPDRIAGTLTRGSLAFELSPDEGTVYYVNHCQSYGGHGTTQVGDDLYAGEAKSTVKTIHDMDELHLVTYDLETGTYTDHGAILLQDGRKPKDAQGLEIGRDGNLYIVGTVPLAETGTEKWNTIEGVRLDTYERATPEVMFEVGLVVMPDPLATHRNGKTTP